MDMLNRYGRTEKRTGPQFWRGAEIAVPIANRSEMHRANLLRPDVLSEVVLLGFGILILASLALAIAVARA
jgi:hypothetical protein